MTSDNHPATFRDLLRYVRASDRATHIRFAVIMTALALFAAVVVLGLAEAILRGLQ